jgi:hypothetical protein
MQEQAHEPWRKPNFREPDMIAARSHAGGMASSAMTAENGWLGDMVHGEAKRAELRAAVDEHRAPEGLEPVDWDGESAENCYVSS